MKKLFYLSSAENFGETMLLGNGRLGAAVYGGINEDVYNLNDDTLWTGYPRDYTKHGAKSFEKIKKLVLDGDILEAQDIAWKDVYGSWCQCYLPAGDLVVKGVYTENVDSYKRTLSLETAIHSVQFGAYRREAFVSYPDDMLCIRYDGAELPELEISLKSILRPKSYVKNGTLYLEGEAPGEAYPHHYDPNDPYKYHGDRNNFYKYEERFIYSDDPKEKGMRYAVGVRVKTDGVVSESEKALCVSKASWLEIYVSAKTSFAGYNKHPYLEGIDYVGALNKILDNVSATDYETIRSRHIDDYKSLYGRLELDIEGGRDDLPTDQRFAMHTEESPDLSLYALVYQYGRYLTIASSRKGTQATNLQGIWNNIPCAPWSCSYTTNINLQMNYWGTCGANLSECCEPLHQLIYDISKTGRATARDLFGAQGFCANHNIDIWRMTHPAGDWRPDGAGFAYFPVAGAWLSRHLYEYYLDTKDIAFLNGEAFDAIIESARFCDSMLIEYEQKLIFCPAASPENRYKKKSRPGQVFGLSKYGAMFQSITKDIFEICIKCCEITGREAQYAEYLEKRLEKLLWLEISDDGRIVEYDNDPDNEEREIHHRHISHLYAFYPAKNANDPKLLEACRRSLEVRGSVSAAWTGAWKACLWAVLGDSSKALMCLDTSAKILTKNMLFPDVYQIDCIFGIMAAVNEILVQEKDGRITLLPALPKQWKNGKIRGLRINGKTVNIEWKDGQVVNSSISNG